MLHGYTGKFLLVDLTERRVRVEGLEEEVVRRYLGGKGLGAYLLFRYVEPQVDPLSAGNALIFVTGPLTRTKFPAAARCGVVTKSPLTEAFLDSYAGGYFGPHMKQVGYDAIVITGKAEKPVYLVLGQDRICIADASHLWGLSTSETEEQLRREAKEDKVSVACIGRAGEKGVRFANIITSRRAFGRGGAGAVMGAKNLKAVVIEGKGAFSSIASGKTFEEVIKRCRKKIADHPLTKKGGVWPSVGTWMTVDVTQVTGTFPTRNWQENVFEHAEEINARAFKGFEIRSRSCFACPIGCSRDTKARWGEKEFVTEGPDYETIYSFGANCGIQDPSVIIAADRLCDDYGMDSISCGGVIAFAMECFEKGLITRKETEGIALSFGDGNALIELIHLIARKEGIGKLLSEGVKIASGEIPGSSVFAMHVKGLELPGYDPRGMKGQALTYALADRGACHVRSNTLRPELLGIPEPVDRYGYEGKAKIVRELQLNYTIFDCLIACLFGTLALSMEDYLGALAAISGWSIDHEELQTIAERVWNLTRLFNVREGFTRKEDTLPERLFSEASSEGPSKGQVVNRDKFEEMLDEYYKLAGWDKATGVPTEEKLKDLGLEAMKF